LVKDLPEKEMMEARIMAGYKNSYEGFGTELSNVPKDQAIEACKASLETSK
jgi:hypothetical protein